MNKKEKKDNLLAIIENFGFIGSNTIDDSFGNAKHSAENFKNLLRRNVARTFTISSGKGSNARSNYPPRRLFSSDVGETYFINNFDAFKNYSSRRFAEQFLKANPNPDGMMLAAYTRFMKSNQFDTQRPDKVLESGPSLSHYGYGKFIRGKQLYGLRYETYNG